MEFDELEKWYCHLKVADREEFFGMEYRECKRYWDTLSIEEKEKIYNDMGGRDAHDHHKWKKGNGSFTD